MNKRKEVLRSLILLSVPTVIEQIMSTLMQYVDTAMVGHLGEQATAAVSTTTAVTWLVNCVPLALSKGTLALLSRANGAGNREQMRRLAGQSAFLTLTVGTGLMLLCLILSPFIPVWMGVDEAVQGPAGRYFFIVSLTLVLRTAMYVFGAAIRSTKNTRLPMRINLASNVLNVILNYILIYAAGLGVSGAAAATAIAYGSAGLAMTAATYRTESLRWSLKDMKPDPAYLPHFGKISLPALASSAASCLGYVFFAGMVAGMGTVTFAAHSIAVNAEELFYVPGYGLRTATSSLIGNALGEGDRAKLRATEQLSIRITLLMMLLSGIILYAAAYPLMHLFTISEETAQLGAQLLRLVAFTEPFFGLMVVLEGIFYGKGQTKGVFFIETGSMWGVRILLTFLVVKVWKLGLRQVWYCMIADNICKAVMLFLLYRRGRDAEYRV